MFHAGVAELADAHDSKLYEAVLVRAKCRDALIDKGFAKCRPRFFRLGIAKLRKFQPLLTRLAFVATLRDGVVCGWCVDITSK
jgi:hypothetical protein